MIIYVETFKTNVIVFFGNISVFDIRLTNNLQLQGKLDDTDNH